MTWTIAGYSEPPFEKAGRLYTRGGDLVIRSDLDSRGFRIPLAGVLAVLDGDVRQVCLLEGDGEAGTARLSASGKAVNFSIGPFHYTTPLRSVARVLAGEQRKAPLFVGREQVKPG
jgi:hypothetical protein